MTIEFSKIESFLKNSKIEFELFNEPEVNYTIASLFEPVEKGFYFYSGTKVLPSSIKNSLLLVESVDNRKDENNNSFILVENAQKVFYKLLSFYFSESTDGTISKNAEIGEGSTIGENTDIGAFTIVKGAKIGANCSIGANCTIHQNVVIGNNVTIEDGSIIGTKGVAWIWDEETEEKIVQPQLGGVVIEDNCSLGANTIIVRGSLNENTKIGKSSLLAPGCRLGHGTQIGEYAHLANGVIIGGNVSIGDNSFIGSGVVFRPKVVIEENTTVGAGAVVVKNTSKPGLTLIGMPAKEFPSKVIQSGIPKALKNKD